MNYVFFLAAFALFAAVDAAPAGTYNMKGAGSDFFEGGLDDIQGALEDIAAADADLNKLENQLEILDGKSGVVASAEEAIEKAVEWSAIENLWASNHEEMPEVM